MIHNRPIRFGELRCKDRRSFTLPEQLRMDRIVSTIKEPTEALLSASEIGALNQRYNLDVRTQNFVDLYQELQDADILIRRKPNAQPQDPKSMQIRLKSKTLGKVAVNVNPNAPWDKSWKAIMKFLMTFLNPAEYLSFPRISNSEAAE